MTCSFDGCGAPVDSLGLCAGHARQQRYKGELKPIRRGFEERYWSRVEKTEGCWLWTGGKNSAGYGDLRLDGQRIKAHRAALMFAGVPIPEGYDVDHLCRNPSCVRPDHLEPVTHVENVRRGVGAEWQRAKTHCPQGHEYTPENTQHKNGGRSCRACKNERARESRRQRKDGAVIRAALEDYTKGKP